MAQELQSQSNLLECLNELKERLAQECDDGVCSQTKSSLGDVIGKVVRGMLDFQNDFNGMLTDTIKRMDNLQKFGSTNGNSRYEGFADFREELKNATEDMKAAYLTNFNALMASLEEFYGKSMEKNMQSFKSSMLQNIRGPRQNPFQDMLQALKCEKDGALPSLSWLTS